MKKILNNGFSGEHCDIKVTVKGIKRSINAMKVHIKHGRKMYVIT